MRVNISYGKIENGVFAYAPYRLDIEGKQIYNGTAEQYAAGGWLPVVHTPQPDVGNYTAAFAEQDGQIVETWALQSTETEEKNDTRTFCAAGIVSGRIHSFNIGGIGIMGLKTNAGLVEYAKMQLGQPYWYGTFGQVSTKSLLDAKTKQYPSHYTATRMTKYNSQLGRRVYDCVGLIKGYIWSETPTSVPKYNAAQDLSANGMLKACKEKGGIDTMPEIPGVLVFLPGHVGVYIGGGYVVEARGFSFGVVKTKIGERPWKNWGKCPFVEYSSGAKAAQSAADVVCRLGDKNSFVYAVKKQLAAAKALGIITQSVDDNNIFGNGTLLAVKQLQSRAEIAVDGVVGIKTVEALNRMIDGATAELRENTAAAMEALT